MEIKLSKPFNLQNGKEITELSLCFEELSVADLLQVKKLEAQISDDKAVSAESMSKPKSLSFEFQLATGFLAAVKGTDGLLISDFTRMSMTDALAIAEEASFFLARCGLNSEADFLSLYGTIGQLSLLYHTDVLGLLVMPIEALYFHFSLIKQGMSHVK